MDKEMRCVATFGTDSAGNPDVTVTLGSERFSVTFCVSADQAAEFAQQMLAAVRLANKCCEKNTVVIV